MQKALLMLVYLFSEAQQADGSGVKNRCWVTSWKKALLDEPACCLVGVEI